MFVQKKIIVMSFLISIVLLSGCIEDTENDNPINNSDNVTSISNNTSSVSGNSSLDSMVIVEQLPDGYEILGTLPISDYNEYSGNIVDAREGAYRDTDNLNVFLDIIELNSEQAALELISNYQAQYKPLDIGDRFTTIHFNGHDATRIIQYKNFGGTQSPKYQVIWNNENMVFNVRSNSHLKSSSLELAKATGH